MEHIQTHGDCAGGERDRIRSYDIGRVQHREMGRSAKV